MWNSPLKSAVSDIMHYSAGDLFLGIDIILTIQMAHTLCESIQGLTSESEIDHMQSHRSALKRHQKNSILQT
jgi:hypothetical protein